MGRKPEYPVKISRPLFRNALERTRLFNLIDDGGAQPLLWISGPAGYGKTTVISTYIDHKKIPAIWYQRDDGDKDPATFFYYLGLACRKETPRKRKPLPLYLPEYSFSPENFYLRFFEAVFDRLEPTSLVVFDNLIQKPEKYFVDTLKCALTRMPIGAQIVILSRTDPPPDLSLQKVRNKMKVIRKDDLRLDPEEFKQLAILKDISEFSEKKLMELHSRLEGWAAGLSLIAETRRRKEFLTKMASGQDIQEIYEFFAGEICNNFDEITRDFLMKTSFLPHLTIRSAKALTGHEGCDHVLNYLTSHNLFTNIRDTEPVTYQYHTLFREYFQDYAADNMTDVQLADIKRSAAKIVEETGQYEQAAALFIQSHSWEDLSSMIAVRAPEMLQHGRQHILEEWIRTIPEDIFSRDRYLQYWMGMCKLPFSPENSRGYFYQSLQLAREAGDSDTSYRSWAGAVDSIVFEFNDLSELDFLIESFDGLRAEFPEYPSEDVEGKAATAMLTALLFRQLEHPMIDEWARRAVSLAMGRGILSEQIMVSLVEAMKHYYMGNMVEMRIIIETMVEPHEIHGMRLSVRPLVYYLIGLKEWTLGNLEPCREQIEKGLETAEATGVHMWDLLLFGQAAASALSAQDSGTAHEYLEKIKKRFGRASKHEQSHYHYLSAWAAVLTGEMTQATSHARKACDLKIQVGNPFGIGSNRLALAETLWANGDQAEALLMLEESRKTAEQTRAGLLSYLCDVVEAYFALDEGDVERAVVLLREAFAFGSAKGIYNFFLFRKDIMSRLCALAIQYSLFTTYAQDLARHHNLVPDSAAQELEQWPWPVKLYTLGPFELVVKGKKVRFTGKSPEKPMSLLKAIAAFGGVKVSANDLADSLWPHSDGPAGLQNLSTTLHRLRKLIGIEDAVIYSENTVTLNPEVFWVDIWAVERVMVRIGPMLENGLASGKELQAISPHIEQILDLYKGHFLSADSSESWSIAPRDRLRSKFIRNLKNYCANLEAQGQVKRAIKWYQKGIELDNLAEEFYQGLILCYSRIGQKSDAIVTYDRCRQLLSEVLGVEPSPATEAVRKLILDKP